MDGGIAVGKVLNEIVATTCIDLFPS